MERKIKGIRKSKGKEERMKNVGTDNLNPEERAEIGGLHKQAEAENAFELGRNIAAKKDISLSEFKEEIKYRANIRGKELEELGVATSDEIEQIIASSIYEHELLDGFQFERRRIG